MRVDCQGDRMSVENKPIYPSIAAALVFLLGFGVMNLFWFTGTWNPELYGLYFFKSATFGDAVILPLIIYYSLHIVHLHKFTFKQALAVILAGFIGLSVGIFSQYQWITSETTVLNWTIPEPHIFNAAGWYHAVFLCAMVAIFAALSIAVLICAVTSKKHKTPFNSAYTRILVLLPAFPIFNLNDFATIDTPPAQIAAKAIGPLTVSFVIGSWFAFRLKQYWLPQLIVFGSFWTSLVVMHSYTPDFSNFEILILVSFAALSAVFPLSLANIIDIKSVALTTLANFSFILFFLSSLIWHNKHKSTPNSDFSLLLYSTIAFITVSLIITASALVIFPRQAPVPLNRLIIRSIQNILIVLFVPFFGIYLYLNTAARTFEAYTVLWSVFAAVGLLFVKSSWSELIKLEDEEALHWGSKTPELLKYKLRMKRIVVWGWSIPVLLDMFIVYMATDLKALSIKKITNKLLSPVFGGRPNNSRSYIRNCNRSQFHKKKRTTVAGRTRLFSSPDNISRIIEFFTIRTSAETN